MSCSKYVQNDIFRDYIATFFLRLSVYKIQLQYIRFNKIEKRFLSMPKRSNLSIYLFVIEKENKMLFCIVQG